MRSNRTKLIGLAAVALAVAAATVTPGLGASADDREHRDDTRADGEFYVDPNSNAYAWLADNPDSPNADTIRTELAERAAGKWYGDWEDSVSVGQYVTDAAAAGQTPILVAYNMYERDCDGQSEGGAETPAEYEAWIADFADQLGDHEAIVILEPDAVAQLLQGCVKDQDARRALLSYAVEQFGDRPNAQVYLDAGNAEWAGEPAAVADALTDFGVDSIRGFALNVSNHYTSDDTDERAAAINAQLAQPVNYVIDTSRNGSGKTDDSDDGWCNPVGATLGEHSTYTDGPADAHLWIKVPGDSDGSCGYGEGIPAGQFSEKLAMALITGEYV